MAFKKGADRNQMLLFPESLDECVAEDSPVRLIDAFVERLDMSALKFQRVEPVGKGRPSYDPKDLLKILIYGYFYGARSSRRMERECKVNVEVMWLTGKLTPDHNTLSEFRRRNIGCMKPMFREFNKFCLKMDMFKLDYVSIDGSKFRAANSKDRNLTLSKLDDRIKRLDAHIDDYLSALEESDGKDDARKLTHQELEEKLAKLKERKARYEGYLKQMEESGASQMSLTDPDSRLMKENNGFGVGYNVQTVVDSESHMIAGFVMTNHPTDHGLITEVAGEVKSDMDVEMLETTADKGYHDPVDMANALENGIVPNVIQNDGASEADVEYDYQESSPTDEQRRSRKPEDIKACLHAGVVPDCMEGILSDAVVEAVTKRRAETYDSEVTKMTPEQMVAKAREGYFVRDAERNLVICPQGQILRPKSVKRSGEIIYYNALACIKCKAKCTTAKFKEAGFLKDRLIKKVEGRGKKDDDDGKGRTPRTKMVTEKKRIVRFKLHLDENKMNNRKCLSEHPFGTIKRTIGEEFFLLRRMLLTEGEMALFCLAYNLRRAMSLRNMGEIVSAMAR